MALFSDPKGGRKGHVDGGGVREYRLLGISGATLSPRGTSDKASSHVGEQDEPAIPKRKEGFVRVESPGVLRKGS